MEGTELIKKGFRTKKMTLYRRDGALKQKMTKESYVCQSDSRD